ncbi:MAG: molybdopterin-dependent oxidoreductase [Proteobacteria bacterium]|nr:molybdopterin-dependent oxidoreductase [Pseudomonadota bacterium]
MRDLPSRLQGKIPGPETGIEIKKSVCTICDPLTQCGLDLYIKDGKIIKVEGTKENPHNGGTLCAKGAATRQYVYHKDRIKTPLKRVGARGSGRFVPISWDEALETIATNLIQTKTSFNPESVVFYVGYPKVMRPFLHRLAQLFGSPNYMTESSTCYQAMAMAQKLNFGIPGAPDIKNAKCFLVWSANPFYTSTGLARKILNAKENGLKIIVIDPRYSPMAAQADIHLQLKPGTDGALALAMANVIIKEKLYDQDFIENYTHGFSEYQEYVQKFSPERGEELTGVPVEKIKEAARLYATTSPGAIMPSASPVVHHTNGVQNYRAVFSLMALTGNYDIPGGNLAEPVSYLYVPAGFTSRFEEFTNPKNLKEMAPRVGDNKFPVWSRLVDEGQAIYLPFHIRSEEPYPIKALLAFGFNYRMWPDSNFMAESLQKLDFIAITDLFMTESCRFADIVLPACSSVERKELRCYREKYIIYTQPAIKPLYESRSDIDIIYALAERLKIDDPLFSAGYEASLDWILEPSGITIEELKKHPGGMPVPNPIKHSPMNYRKDGFMTPSGKMEFKSLLLEEYSDSFGYEGLPAYHPPKYSQESSPDIAADYPLILNTGSRLPMFIHSQTFRLSWTQSLRPEPSADLNPDDASRLRISQGDQIKLSTPKGSIIVKANLTDIVQSGVVHMFHAYSQADVNTLIEADYVDPVSGFPGFKSLLCKVEKVECQKNRNQMQTKSDDLIRS